MKKPKLSKEARTARRFAEIRRIIRTVIAAGDDHWPARCGCSEHKILRLAGGK